MDVNDARIRANRVFVRLIIQRLMVDECMRAPDPVAEARSRSEITLTAIDNVTDEEANQLLSHAVLDEMETFWKAVREEVGFRVRSESAE